MSLGLELNNSRFITIEATTPPCNRIESRTLAYTTHQHECQTVQVGTSFFSTCIVDKARQLLALLLLQLLVVVKPQGQTAFVRDRFDGFQQFVSDTQAEWKVPGLAVAVVDSSGPIFSRGFGIAAKNVPVDEDVGNVSMPSPAHALDHLFYCFLHQIIHRISCW